VAESLRPAIADEGNDVLVSAASAREIATKQYQDMLAGVPDARSRFDALVAADGFVPLPISSAHVLHAGAHPSPHRAPSTTCWPHKPCWKARRW
jgi:PIN domain nuclease of toxin-antitoxin system